MANEVIPPPRPAPKSEAALQDWLASLSDGQRRHIAQAGQQGAVPLMIELIKAKLASSGLSPQEMQAAVPPAFIPAPPAQASAITK